MAILFDLDDTLLDDRGAQEAYLGDLYSNHRSEIQGTDPAIRQPRVVSVKCSAGQDMQSRQHRDENQAPA